MNASDNVQDALIDDDAVAARHLRALETATSIGLDTEFIRDRTYYPRLCLLQIKVASAANLCLDPLRLDKDLLGRKLAAFGGVTVIHSAAQDLEVLRHDLKFTPANLFDTQVAASMLGMSDQIGYAGLVEELFDTRPPKGQTRTDWSRRPLSAAQLHYAHADVEYLCAIHEALCARLEAEGKLDWFAEESRRLAASVERDARCRLIERHRAGAELPAPRQGCFLDLLLWREDTASRLDRPREWIVSTADLLAVARNNPHTPSELEGCTRLNAAQTRKFGREVLRISRRSRPREQPVWPAIDPLDADERKMLKTLQRRIRGLGAELKASPTLLATRQDLECLLRGRRGRLDEGWRARAVKPRLLDAF